MSNRSYRKKREKVTCLPNFNSAADQVREKRVSQRSRPENWLLGCLFSNQVNNLVGNGVAFCQAINLSGFDVESNLRQMAELCRIFILQKIKLEKNGFQ